MKIVKVLLAVLISSLFGGASAQTDPITQYLDRTMFPSLVSYDSLTLSTDTGANFMAYATASMDYVFQDNSKIDTCIATRNGSATSLYKGTWRASSYELVAFSASMPGDTTAKFIFYRNQAGLDSLMKVYIKTGTGLEYSGSLIMNYNSNSKLNEVIVTAVDVGTGIDDTTITIAYFYNQGRLDSLYQEVDNAFQAASLKLKYHYQGNVLVDADIFMDTAGAGNYEHEGMYHFKNNSHGKIYETHMYQKLGTDMQLLQVNRYSIKTNSSIGLNENRIHGLSLYPNPATNHIRIESENAVTDYEIMAINGKLVKQGQLQSGNIDIQELEKGAYLLRLKTAGQYQVKGFQKK